MTRPQETVKAFKCFAKKVKSKATAWTVGLTETWKSSNPGISVTTSFLTAEEPIDLVHDDETRTGEPAPGEDREGDHGRDMPWKLEELRLATDPMPVVREEQEGEEEEGEWLCPRNQWSQFSDRAAEFRRKNEKHERRATTRQAERPLSGYKCVTEERSTRLARQAREDEEESSLVDWQMVTHDMVDDV